MGVAIGPVEAYQRAAARFGECIATLADEDWERTTRPAEWTVATTVAWVVVGDAQIATAIHDGRVGSVADFDVSVLGPNPVATWRGTALGALRALDEPGALDREVAHPVGTLVVADLVGQRVSENLVRAADVRVATGRSLDVPDDLAEWCLEFWAGHARAVIAGGVLPDHPRAPEPGATAAERLLALTGR